MAIFLGNWLDGEGVPFDPSAQQNRSTPTGGSAQATRSGRAPFFHNTHFAACVTYHAAKWLNELTSGERDDWEIQGDSGVWKRGSATPSVVNGFCAFNAVSFVHTFYPDTIDIKGPGLHNVEIGPPYLEEPEVATQTISFNYDYTPDWAAGEHATCAVYQIDPADLARPWPVRDTRLIYKRILWAEPHEKTHVDVGAAFAFDKKTDAAILFRAHSASKYRVDYPRRWAEPPF